MRLLELFAELRRRRVVRTGAAYLIAAWLIIQVAATVFPILGFPDWATRVVLGLVLIGLPVTLVLAWSFDLTPDGFERTHPAEHRAPSPPSARRRRVLTGALIIVAVLAGSGWFAASTFVSARAAELDGNLIAVAPFRVTGADAGVAYLREGMVDLIAVKLTGTRRAVEPSAALSAWRHTAGEGEDPSAATAMRLAARLGARTVLVGAVVGSADALTLSASLYDAATGHLLATGSVPGTAAELPALVDQLVATVLSLEAGERAEHLTSLTSTSLPAVRAYLDGNVHYRRGRYVEAVQSYTHALAIDSTFALAALALYDPAGMETSTASLQQRARQLVEANIERLPPRERAYYDARFPRERAPHVAAWLRSLERLTELFPDRWEAWYAYADGLYHWGSLVGPVGSDERARAGFERALALDSTHSVVIQHLIMVAAKAPDTATVFRFSERYLREHPSGAFAFEMRLRTAAWRHDTATVQRMLTELDTLGIETLTGIVGNHQLGPRAGTGLTFARRASDILLRKASNTTERANAVLQRVVLELNSGRPRAALALQDSIRRAERIWWPRERVYHALFMDGDTAAATEAAAVMESRLRTVTADTLGEAAAADLCALVMLRLTRGQTEGMKEAIARLRDPRGVNPAIPAERTVCAETLETLLSRAEQRADTLTRLLSLDSLMRTGPHASSSARDRANLLLARLFDERGDIARAYEAANRRFNNAGGERYSRPFYELQCRLAAATGRAQEALWACERYLLLLENAEPELLPKAELARRTLADVTAERRR